MSTLSIALGHIGFLMIILGIWMIIGMVVVESCRMAGAWWFNPLYPAHVALWPAVLLITLFKRW